MKNVLKKQQGVTFIGWCIILAIIAFFVTLTLRLFPLYNERMIVVSAMKSVSSRPGISEMTNQEIMSQVLRTVQVGGSKQVTYPTLKQTVSIEKPREAGGNKMLTVQFEMRNKFFQDIYLLMDFNESYELRGGGGE